MTVAELKNLLSKMDDNDDVTLQVGDAIYEIAEGQEVAGWPNFLNLKAGEFVATNEE